MGLSTAIEPSATADTEDLTRSDFLRRGAVVVGALAGFEQLTRVAPAFAVATGPKPIPGGFNGKFEPVAKNAAAHVFQPLKGGELNTIGDFNGFVAASEIQGFANGSDGTSYSFDCDMRFMQGSYVALDGRLRQGTFGFI
jgi:hypothetical protein